MPEKTLAMYIRLSVEDGGLAHQRIRARATVLPISGRSFKAISSRLMICALIALRNSVMTVIAEPALSDRISSA